MRGAQREVGRGAVAASVLAVVVVLFALVLRPVTSWADDAAGTDAAAVYAASAGESSGDQAVGQRDDGGPAGGTAAEAADATGEDNAAEGSASGVGTSLPEGSPAATDVATSGEVPDATAATVDEVPAAADGTPEKADATEGAAPATDETAPTEEAVPTEEAAATTDADTAEDSDDPAEAVAEDAADADSVAGDLSGTCRWSIDTGGLLLVEPINGREGILGGGSPWSEYCSRITSVRVEGIVHARVCEYMFADCTRLASADLTGLDTSAATDMSWMFRGCSALTSLDLSRLDTGAVTSMQGMFEDCSSLASLNVSTWDTSSVMDMSFQFSGCKALATLDVSDWETSLVEDMSLMFYGCSSLAALDVSDWETSFVTSMSSMFQGCAKLASLNVANWDTGAVTDMGSLFSGCAKLSSLGVAGWDTAAVENMSDLFGGCPLTSLDLSGWDTSAVTNMSWMFSKCSRLATLKLAGWDTSSVVDMRALFQDCSSLASLDLSRWNTSSVVDMGSLFLRCSKLSTLDISGWDTGAVEDMSGMFSGCVLSRVEVGDGCVFAKGVFPKSRATDGRWLSMRDGDWFAASVIEKTRAGMADTYTSGAIVLGRFKPVPIKLGTATVAAQTYAGAALRPVPKVTLGGKTLKAGTDFSLAYKNNVNVGTATVTITGKGGYKGTISKTFKVKPAPMSRTTVATIASRAYTGKAYAPQPKVTMGGKTLGAVTDYTVSYRNAQGKTVAAKDIKAAGTYSIVLTGRGNFTNTTRVTYAIKPLSIAKAKIAAIPKQYFTGKALKPAPKVTASVGGKTVTLKLGTDYTMVYANNVKPGTATITVRGTGNFAGSVKVTFKVLDRWQRLAGPNAVATMQSIVRADDVFTAAKVSTVVVAGRRDFKAALTGVGLAGLYKAPLLITDSNSGTLSGPARDELLRLKPSRVIVVGDTSVVPTAHYNGIRAAVPKASVTRVAGSSASGTAVAIHAASKSASVKWGKTCVIATQAAFKDALSIAPYAYAKHAPIFFTESTRIGDGKGLSNASAAAIRGGGFSRVLIVGGELAVSGSVYYQLPGIEIQRLAGANAIETSKAIAQFELGEGMNRKHLAIATTQDFADALAGAALAGAQGSVLLLSNQIGGFGAFDAIYRPAELVHGHILGGPFALSEDNEYYFRNR